jgi:hypothetical protein
MYSKLSVACVMALDTRWFRQHTAASMFSGSCFALWTN